MKYYFDSNIFIYTIESNEIYQPCLDRLYASLNNNDQIITSFITKLECLRKPLREKNLSLTEDFEAVFSNQLVTLLPVTESISAKTLELFKSYNFKLADAIHIATALTEQADFFITNDARLIEVAGLKVKILAEM